MQRLQHAYSMNVYIPTCFDLSNLSRHILTHWLKVPKVVPLTFFQCTYLCGGHCEQHDEHHRSDPSRIMLMPQLRELIHISSLNYVIVSLSFYRSFHHFSNLFKALGWADDKCIHYVCILYSCCFHYAPTMYSWFVFICFHIMHSHLYSPCIHWNVLIFRTGQPITLPYFYIFLYNWHAFSSPFSYQYCRGAKGPLPMRGPFLPFHVVPRCSKWMCQLMSRACGTPWNTYQMHLESNNTELYTLISMFNYLVCEHSQPSS